MMDSRDETELVKLIVDKNTPLKCSRIKDDLLKNVNLYSVQLDLVSTDIQQPQHVNSHQMKIWSKKFRICITLFYEVRTDINKSFLTWGVSAEGDAEGRFTPWLPLKTSLHKTMSRIKIYGRFQCEFENQLSTKIGLHPQSNKSNVKKKIHWFHLLGGDAVLCTDSVGGKKSMHADQGFLIKKDGECKVWCL